MSEKAESGKLKVEARITVSNLHQQATARRACGETIEEQAACLADEIVALAKSGALGSKRTGWLSATLFVSKGKEGAGS